jgi:PDZ domain-containing secreted protein
MITAMQEMIQNIIDIESKTYNQEQLYMLTALKVSAIMLLKLEKEQMIDFANCFYDDCVTEGGSLKQSAEEYYNQTYNKNQS